MNAAAETYRRAVESERILFPGAPRHPVAAIGKTLLVSPAHLPLPAPQRLSLEPVTDWSRYEQFRIEVEAGFGVGPEAARAMVATLRERASRIGLILLFACTPDDVVGAIGHFALPDRRWARLQEVDVFPAWRGQGLGNALLEAVFRRLAGNGTTAVIVGADEDDWPLEWYRRRGFADVARVPLTR